MKHKVIKAGTHSLAVIIPADFVHTLGVKSGDEVIIQTDKDKGKVSVYFKGVMQLSLTSNIRK